MSAHSILDESEGRLRELNQSWAEVRLQHGSAAAVLVLTALWILVLEPYAGRHHILLWWFPLWIPIAAVSVRRFRQYQTAQSRTWRLKRFYGRTIQRVRGEWSGEGFTGDEFPARDHTYARDLGVFGKGSLFELLCIARTAIGRRHLARYLLDAPAVDELLLRQEAVRELAPRKDLREQIAVLGEYESAESHWATFANWLDSPPLRFPRSLPLIAGISSSLLAAILCFGLLTGGAGLLPWIRIAMWIWPLVLFHAVVGTVFRARINASIESLRSLSVETRVFREGLQLLESSSFRCRKLALLAERVRDSSQAVRKLERLLGALNQRDKDGFYLLSRMLLGGTQICVSVEQWRRQYEDDLRVWLEAWGEFEALNSLGNHSYENRDHTFPEFAAAGACFEAVGLGHPLLQAEICVRNEVRLNAATRFYVISGSNMSGKSTLLRSIGLNAVLAFAGAPVRARELRISELSVCASISLVDSLLTGRSKFLAELERLRETIEATAAKRSVLFLVDEIFSGTNSRDRRMAAEAVVRTLVNSGAIGALSTHDMSLTEIAEGEGLRGTNVHMGAMDGGGPMNFDYLLKAGVSTETNALAIARMAGVPV